MAPCNAPSPKPSPDHAPSPIVTNTALTASLFTNDSTVLSSPMEMLPLAQPRISFRACQTAVCLLYLWIFAMHERFVSFFSNPSQSMPSYRISSRSMGQKNSHSSLEGSLRQYPISSCAGLLLYVAMT